MIDSRSRYYLAPIGEPVPQTPVEDHADVGRRILASLGVIPVDYSDIYDQMEILGYFRVVEFPQRVFAENSNCPSTHSQMAFLQERRFADGGNRELVINDELFTETRRGGGLSHEELAKICSEDGAASK